MGCLSDRNTTYQFSDVCEKSILLITHFLKCVTVIFNLINLSGVDKMNT